MIQFKTIDGLLLRDMIVAGTALLEKNREAVDALNVFPVPDGDTGTNMSLTMQSATREVNSKEFLRADEAANALAKGALKGARGNSGVITSQLLRGFAKSLNGVEKITPVQFAQALAKGSEMAYKAVMRQAFQCNSEKRGSNPEKNPGYASCPETGGSCGQRRSRPDADLSGLCCSPAR